MYVFRYFICLPRLVGESQIQPGLSPTYTGTSKNVSAPGLAGELREIRAGAQTRLRFCRLPVRPQVWSGPTDSGPVTEPSRENTETAIPTGLPGPGIHALDRFTNSYRKASSSRPTSYKTHSVASVEGTRITRKVIPIPRSLHPHLQWWLRKTMYLQANHYTQYNMLCKYLQTHQKKGGALT